MPTIVLRSDWGARAPKAVYRIALPTPRLWIHHTATEQHGAAGVRAIQAFHMDSHGWSDIAYSFLVDDDGTIYEGRGAGVAGGHTQGDNTTSHAICLMGNFEDRPPTDRAVESTVWLAQHGRDAGWWVPTLGGHRDAPGASTACPGRLLYAALPTIRLRVAGALPVQEDDMPYTEAQLKTIFRSVLDEGTGAGQVGWAGTVKAILAGVQGTFNEARGARTAVAAAKTEILAEIAAEDDVDEAEVARQVLAVLTAGEIAAAIPGEIAANVADELAARLAG